MQKTENYQLNQWDKTDRIMMEDFNADNVKLEQALATQAEALGSAVAKMGNCIIKTLSYTGTNQNKQSITFEKTPLFVIIIGSNGEFMSTYYGCAKGYSIAGSLYQMSGISWTATSMSWTPANSYNSMNTNAISYQVFYFCLAD